MQAKTPITVAHGDGIGPEIMDATLHILSQAGAALEIETIEIGEKVYLQGQSAGIEPHAWESLRRTKVFLKAPITTPQGGGFKSLNVTVRKGLGLFANVRPCVSYHPFVDTKHPAMDVVIVRENEEDLYAGIEYRLSNEVYQCLKLISVPGCEKIIRFAFDFAKQNNRKKVTCFTKDNIMKFTDGIFHKTFDRIAAQYQSIENEHWIVDIGAAKLADSPESFDVIVMPNLYGDILSDVAAQIAGSVGLAGSSNIGVHGAMFEAIHGSAPRRAGQNLANPSGLLLAGVMMLVHIGQGDVAARVHNAWLKTIEDGVHTYDIYADGVSRTKVGTREFANAVVQRLGQVPQTLKQVSYSAHGGPRVQDYYKTPIAPAKRELQGVDIFVHWPSRDTDKLASILKGCENSTFRLTVMTNRGVKVWPEGMAETFRTDQNSCRFIAQGPIETKDMLALMGSVASTGCEIIKMETLYSFDGEAGFTKGQGE